MMLPSYSLTDFAKILFEQTFTAVVHGSKTFEIKLYHSVSGKPTALIFQTVKYNPVDKKITFKTNKAT
jgi:hypothetical protein